MTNETHTWPDLAIALYDKLTGRGAEICYTFSNLDIYVPASTALDALQAHWKVNGSLTVTTRDGN
jgi:hypothetical protein